MRKILFALIIAFGFVQIASAQNERCGTDIMYKRAKARNPFLVQAGLDYEALVQQGLLELSQNREGDIEAVLVIPVVFHIIHQNGPENVSDAQIFNAMMILNRDFAKMNADTIQVVEHFNTIIANCKIEFRLATKDFLGNCTNGIERISSIETYIGDNGSKLSQWPRERYLNVWTVANMENGVAGFSQLPGNVIDAEGARADGVILRHNYLGAIGTAAGGDGRTLTHEVGHYLNLSHTWGGTNDPEVACDDDGVADTPTTAGHNTCATLYDFECTRAGMNSSTQLPNITPIYNFAGVSTTSGTTDPTTAPIGMLPQDSVNRIIFGGFSASGVSTNSMAAGKFAYSNWSTGAPDGATTMAEMTGAISTADYYQFTITPIPGTLMTLQNLGFDVSRNGTGIRNYAVRSSLNNFATSVGVSNVASNLQLTAFPTGASANTYFINEDVTGEQLGSKFNLPATYSNLSGPVTFRIYGWNAEDADGTFEIDNVALTGIFGLNENIQNYMEYSFCSFMFTIGQKDRMRTTLSLGISGRSNLYSEQNRFLTGTDDNPLTCAPVADFYPANRFVCIGDQTTMRDNSTNGTVTSWLWTFQDGNPATSTQQNPTVSFTSHGRKTITLTVGNAQGTDTKTIEQSVIVAPNFTEFPGGWLQEGFDSYDEFYNQWHPGNFDNNMSSFQQINYAGFSNNTSAKLNAYDMDVTNIDEGGNDIDDLVSPVMDLSNIGGDAAVNFKWAFATQSIDLASITDKLEVYISNNCGKTWSGTPRFSKLGLDLVTAQSVSVAFVPQLQSEWNEGSFLIPASYRTSGFRMMFIFSASELPNNLYLDNINVTGSVSVENLDADFYGAELYPNPAEGSTTLTYENRSANNMEITLTDMSGRVVNRWMPNNQSGGLKTMQIATEDLAKGLYMVNLRSAANSTTLKLVVR